MKKDATGTADQSLRCVAIEKHHSNVKKQPSTTNLVEENIRAIERSFLLQQKAKDEEIGDSESVHCLYIEKEQLETISRHKRYHSSVEFSSSEKAAGRNRLRLNLSLMLDFITNHLQVLNLLDHRLSNQRHTNKSAKITRMGVAIKGRNIWASDMGKAPIIISKAMFMKGIGRLT